MKYTSAQANKLLRALREEHHLITAEEANNRFFLAASGEDPESLRPEYDYDAVQQDLAAIEAKIRTVKHAINLFNCSTVVEGKTIDELLVYLPQLQDRRGRLSCMIGRRTKQRADRMMSRYSGPSAIIDYEYANYDVKKAEADYRRIGDEIARLQTALDAANAAGEIEIDVEL